MRSIDNGAPTEDEASMRPMRAGGTLPDLCRKTFPAPMPNPSKLQYLAYPSILPITTALPTHHNFLFSDMHGSVATYIAPLVSNN